MKSWLLTLFVIAACGGVITWVISRKVIPGFLENANQEMVADWHAGLMGRYREIGTWPDISDPKAFSEQVYIVIGADGRRIVGGYMHGRETSYNPNQGSIMDVYNRPMKLSFSGDTCLVASSGPNGIWGDTDDASSDKVKERYFGATLEGARALAAAKASKKK